MFPSVWDAIKQKFSRDETPPGTNNRGVPIPTGFIPPGGGRNNPNNIPGEPSPAYVFFNPAPDPPANPGVTPVQQWLYENFPGLSGYINNVRATEDAVTQKVGDAVDDLVKKIPKFDPVGDLKDILFYAAIILGTGGFIYLVAVIRSSLRS